tara:strand:- start:777 stop:950 length:174 start_codon:yes stop_codon:yes gene_type:complete
MFGLDKDREKRLATNGKYFELGIKTKNKYLLCNNINNKSFNYRSYSFKLRWGLVLVK